MNLAAGDDLASAGRDRFNAMNAIDDVYNSADSPLSNEHIPRTKLDSRVFLIM